MKMNRVEPFLFRFKREVVSPSRAALKNNDEVYDESIDMLMVLEDGKWIYAIDGKERRKTKKCDIEKGEDQKDDRIWR
jgi:hypothetical protein